MPIRTHTCSLLGPGLNCSLYKMKMIRREEDRNAKSPPVPPSRCQRHALDSPTAQQSFWRITWLRAEAKLIIFSIPWALNRTLLCLDGTLLTSRLLFYVCDFTNKKWQLEMKPLKLSREAESGDNVVVHLFMETSLTYFSVHLQLRTETHCQHWLKPWAITMQAFSDRAGSMHFSLNLNHPLTINSWPWASLQQRHGNQAETNCRMIS